MPLMFKLTDNFTEKINNNRMTHGKCKQCKSEMYKRKHCIACELLKICEFNDEKIVSSLSPNAKVFVPKIFRSNA